MGFFSNLSKKVSSWYRTTAKPAINNWYATSAKPATKATPNYILTDRTPVEPLINRFDSRTNDLATGLNDVRTGKSISDKVKGVRTIISSLVRSVNDYNLVQGHPYSNPDSEKTASYELGARALTNIYKGFVRPLLEDKAKEREKQQLAKPMQFAYQH